jgi:hypothetical protein
MHERVTLGRMARAAEQLRRLAPLIWLCAPPSVAAAQDANGAAQAAHADDLDARADARTPLVLFLVPADAEDQALRDALSAQFALIDADLVFETETRAGEGSLSRRFSQAHELAASRSAIAVFWLDMPADGRWLLHMMDAQDERVIVRAVDASGERRPAAIEAVAVMTRSSTRALIEDEPAPAPPPAPTPAPPVPAPAAAVTEQPAAASSATHAPPPDWLRLFVGYTGDHFAPSVWQHGIALGGGFLGFPPLTASLGLTLMPTIDVISDAVTFSIRRLPFNARAGYRLRIGILSLDGEVAFLVEWLHRNRGEQRPTTGLDVTLRGERDAFLFALGPRVRAELRLATAVGLYAGAGLDILLNDFAYVSRGVGARDVLRPDSVRPVADLGISFYP